MKEGAMAGDLQRALDEYADYTAAAAFANSNAAAALVIEAEIKELVKEGKTLGAAIDPIPDHSFYTFTLGKFGEGAFRGEGGPTMTMHTLTSGAHDRWDLFATVKDQGSLPFAGAIVAVADSTPVASRLGSPRALAGIAAAALIAIGAATAGLAMGHIGPFSTQTKQASASSGGQPVVAQPPVGLKLTGYTMDLTFSNPVFGDCPAASKAITPSKWGGSWIFAMSPGAGNTTVAVNAKPGANSPFGNWLNGFLVRDRMMTIKGDSTIENQILKINFDAMTAASIRASMPVTGSTDVSIHDQQGECKVTYDASGHADPPK
jgi:hypothetical protein